MLMLVYCYTDSPCIRKVYNPLLESILNHHILTIKHLKITVVGEYTYGLPCFLLGK